MPTLLQSISQLVHPVYKALEETWETNERRYHAGVDATEDLTPFKWETPALPSGEAKEEAATRALARASRRQGPQASYHARRARAVFPDFMGEYAERLCGELFSKAPAPATSEDGDEDDGGTASGADGSLSFGALGAVGHLANGDPTRAQMLWDNADGVGDDARSWDAFWYDEAAAATATGFRWVYVEGARDAPGTGYEREVRGARPYLVGLSPLDVPAWGESAGRLDYAVLKLSERRLKVEGEGASATVTDEAATVYHVLVREGFEGFGNEMSRGGWWIVDDQGALLVDAAGNERKGDWAKTGGQIPLTRLYYERPPKTGATTRSGAPAGLKAGTYALGGLAADLMDLNSVAIHDTWTSAKRQRFVPVRDKETAEHLAKNASNPVVFVPMPEGGRFQVEDSAAESANVPLVTERAAITAQADRFIRRELATSADASGRAREIEHARGTSPRLASMARNVMEAQNACLRFLEGRWVDAYRTGTARATWTERFDLESVARALLPLIEALAAAGLTSPTLTLDYVVASLREAGGLPEGPKGQEKIDRIRDELAVGYERTVASLEADRDALAARPDIESRLAGVRAARATSDAASPAAADAVDADA